MPLIAFRA